MRYELGGILVVGLLGGCAGASGPAGGAPVAEPDCSFRAATSCWTVSARLPPRQAQPADSAGRELTAPPRVLVAKTETDGSH